MTTQVINRTVVLEKKLYHLECSACSIDYALGANFIAERRRDHKSWYCPNGHKQFYPAKNTEEQAIAERDAARSLARREARRREEAEGQARRLEYQRRAAKGQLTKIRNRIAAGLCPCCGKDFPELEAHITEAHPDFTVPNEIDHQEGTPA